MQSTSDSDLTDSIQLSHELAKLAAVAPTDAPFLSCYLDTRMGRAACLAHVQSRVQTMRQGLSGVERLDLESALQMTLAEIERSWSPQAGGMAVFARSLAGGRYLSVLRFAAPFVNRVVWYRAPEILPLFSLLQNEPATSVLLARGDGLELLDFEFGFSQARAWAQAPLSTSDSIGSGRRSQGTRSTEQSLQTMRRCVAAGDRPLLLAGDVTVMRELADWLPARASSRLVGSIALSAQLQGDAALLAIREQIRAMHADHATQLVSRLVNRLRVHGSAAAGQRAALEALRDGSAEVLLVADRCTTAAQGAPWDALIELPRLAHEQGTRVVLSDADALRYLGGVGCLLHRPEESGAMPLPRAARQLDLVA